MNIESIIVYSVVGIPITLILFDCFIGEMIARRKGMEYRIKEVVDTEIGNYYVIAEKHLFWWWQTEPGYHYTRENAERRINYIKKHGLK